MTTVRFPNMAVWNRAAVCTLYCVHISPTTTHLLTNGQMTANAACQTLVVTCSSNTQFQHPVSLAYRPRCRVCVYLGKYFGKELLARCFIESGLTVRASLDAHQICSCIPCLYL